MTYERESAIPAPVKMMGLITGYWISQAIGVVAALEVPDRLATGARNIDEVAVVP
jgi:hypothetical protein